MLVILCSTFLGLFQKGIMQCGYGLNPTWTYQTNHIERAFELGKELKFEGSSKEELLDFLRQQDEMTLFMGFLTIRERSVKVNITDFKQVDLLAIISLIDVHCTYSLIF